MKLYIYFSTLALLLILCACGKKSEVKDKENRETLVTTEAHTQFLALKEIKRAVNENDPKALKKVLTEEPDIDLDQIQLETGETFLTTAIKNDFRAIRNILVTAGASIEKANTSKETPLIVAVATGRLNSIKFLLDHKVNLEAVDVNGDTALHVAIKKELDSIAVLLINAGANIYAFDKQGKNAIKLSRDYRLKETQEHIRRITEIERGAPDLSTFRTLLENADYPRLRNVIARYPRVVTDKAYQAINPLAILVDAPHEQNALKSAELLLSYEANVDGPENAYETPLIKATRANKKAFADLFLASKANPQLIDKDGKSALIHAIEQNNEELVSLLVGSRAMVKYTYQTDHGTEVTYSACVVARRVSKRLIDPVELEISKNIRKKLNCFNRFL